MSKIKLLFSVRDGLLDQHTLETIAREEDMEIVGDTPELQRDIGTGKKAQT